LYNGLRLVRKRVFSKKLVVTEFYQPAEVVTRDALDWLDSRTVPEKTSFYLFLHYMDPHDPYMDADKPGVGYARVQMENPPPEMREPMKKAYNDEIRHLDKYLGELFDGLRQRGLYDAALIVFTSDHGEEFYDHEGWWHGQTLFDELMHVPLIIKLPGNARAGDANSHLARHVDVPPTFLHFAGLEQPAAMPGMSLFGQDNADANGDTSFVYAEVDFENNILQAVRTHDAKLMRANPDNPRRTPPVAFYDLKNDPIEKTDLFGDQNPRKPDEAALADVLDGMIAFTRENAAEPALQTGVSTDVKDQLESLGYLK
jgi:arylsulfatase A-like enzyme